MSEVVISIPHANARLEGTKTFLDTGAGVARIRLYTAPRPADGAAITTQVLLVEVALLKPCGTVADGELPLESTDLPIIANSGDAAWGRAVNGDGDWAYDGNVTDLLGTGAFKLENVTLFQGGRLAVLEAVLT